MMSNQRSQEQRFDDITSRFSYHNADAVGVEKMEKIRKACRDLAMLIDELSPVCREQSSAITHLQMVMMFANSAIVQQYPIKI